MPDAMTDTQAAGQADMKADGLADVMIGRQIGSYHVLRKIGEGGMGTVYEAVHTTLGRRAAVKILRRSTLSDTTAAARFFNEAKAISMVSHPCLVTIFEHGTYRPPDGGGDEAYIVMEYIEGESLRARLERTYLGGSAIGLIRQLASALAVTHKQRIVHRERIRRAATVVELAMPGEPGNAGRKEVRAAGGAAPWLNRTSAWAIALTVSDAHAAA